MNVSFIVVAYNAADKLPILLRTLKAQDYPREKIEVLLVDSMSTDNTRAVMERFCKENPGFARAMVLDNPKKILPAGWNVALRACRGDVIVRVDAHATIAPDFLSQNVRQFENGEKIVGGPRPSVIDEHSKWQKTLLLCETSLFGSGIARYRRSAETAYVSTLAHGAYGREVFEKVGGYDERMVRTEDNEMHHRMKLAGYKLLFDPGVKSRHHARSSLPKMVRQKYGNGYWIGITTAVSPYCFSPYHYAPALLVLGLLGAGILGLLGIWWPMIAGLCLYGAANLGMSVMAWLQGGLNPCNLLMPILFLTLHLCYGVGTVWGLLKIPFWKRKNPPGPEMDEVRQTMMKNRREGAA